MGGVFTNKAKDFKFTNDSYRLRNSAVKQYIAFNKAIKIPGGFVRAALAAEWLSNILSRGCKSYFTHLRV